MHGYPLPRKGTHCRPPTPVLMNALTLMNSNSSNSGRFGDDTMTWDLKRPSLTTSRVLFPAGCPSFPPIGLISATDQSYNAVSAEGHAQ